MGTNFYLVSELEAAMFEDCVWGEDVSLHIGKRSNGWSFCFSTAYGTIKSYKAWKERISQSDKLILDEYGKLVGKEEFYDLVESLKSGVGYTEFWCDPRRKKTLSDLPPNEVEFKDDEGYRFSKMEKFR